MKKHSSPLFLLALFIVAAGTFLYISGEVISESFKPGPLSYRYSPQQLQMAQLSSAANSPLAYYAFDENSGSVAGDASGHDNNADLIGSPSWTTGKFGSAISMNGSSNYVRGAVGLIPAGAVTVCAWINPAAFSAGNMDIVDNTVLNFSVFRNGYLYLNGSSSHTNTNGPVLNTGTWQHVCGVVDGSGNGTLYLNGSSVGSGPVGVITSSAWNTGIGVRGTLAGDYFNGALDEVRIYTTALSAADISTIYSSTPGTQTSVPTPPQPQPQPPTQPQTPQTPTTPVGNPQTGYNISLQFAGAGAGHIANSSQTLSVTSSNYIFCATNCVKSGIPAGTTETFLAVPSNGNSMFIGWSGACSGTGPCTVTINSDTTITANFSQNTSTYTLTVYKSHEGSGSVSGPGISCVGKTCTLTAAAGSSVSLTATPDASSVFLYWGGVCSGSGTCTVTMNQNQVATAIFQTKAAMNGPTANGIVEPGEVCDGSAMDGVTTLPGYKGGTLLCRSDRMGYDLSQMIPGGVVYAKSCASADVQAAIDSASDGDTVVVPPGACTWTVPVHIGSKSYSSSGYSGKNLVLEGSPAANGQPQTTIYDNSSVGVQDVWLSRSPIHVMTTADKPVRITGFIFDGTHSYTSSPTVLIEGDVVGSHNRVDHNTFNHIMTRAVTFSTYGVIDHNYFTRDPSSNAATLISIFGDLDASWSRPQDLGTAHAAIIEDNTFDHCCVSNGVYDNYQGARYVFRYNTVYGSHLGHHGYDSDLRGEVSYEIYNNTFVNASPSGTPYPHDTLIENRSGTGVVFNNTVTRSPNATASAGYYDQFLLLRNYRSSDGYYWGPGNQSGGSFCDGTPHLDGELDGDAVGMLGYPCKDQIGRTTNEELSPTYSWNNNFQGSIGGFINTGGYGVVPPGGIDRYTTHIVEGRDYYNAPKPGYVPYPHPDPLVLADGASSLPPIPAPTSSASPTPTTAAGDVLPPDRSNGAPSGTIPFSSAVTLSLTTNENATCKYSTSSGQAFTTTTAFTTTGALTHSSLITNLTTGSYNYYVKCQDTAGNTNLDDYPILFSIAPQVIPTTDTQAPSVIIARPLPGQTYTTGRLPIQASASDNIGVKGVTFFVDNYQLGSEVTASPYSVNWKATTGTHTIYAVARDAAGNSTKSGLVTVNIVSR